MYSQHPVPPGEDFRQLLERARSGCTEDLGRLLGVYHDSIHALARARLPRLLNPRLSPSDVVQEALVAAYQHFDQFRGNSPNEFHDWLSTIVVNTLRSLFRSYELRKKRKVSREVPFDALALPASGDATRLSTPSACDQLIAQEEHAAVNRCITLLPEVYRQVLHLRYYDDFTFRELGTILRISPEAARKLRARSLLALAALVKKERIGDTT